MASPVRLASGSTAIEGGPPGTTREIIASAHAHDQDEDLQLNRPVRTRILRPGLESAALPEELAFSAASAGLSSGVASALTRDGRRLQPERPPRPSR